jgi:D-glycero-D-manno-heptose 1,7-bisphosphate phosphatase
MTRRISLAPHVRLCLSGHDHNPPHPELHGSTLIAVTTSFVEHPHAFRVFDVPADPGAPVTFEDHAIDPERPLRPAVFLDRDGTINDLAAYHFGPERFTLLPGAGDAIRRLNDAGFLVVVQSRQSCIGKGLVPYEVVRHVHDRMHRLLGTHGARVDAVYFSAGSDDANLPMWRGTADAKPSPKLLISASREYAIDLDRSWMIGDAERDIEAAMRAGIRPILVRTGLGAKHEAEALARFPRHARG